MVIPGNPGCPSFAFSSKKLADQKPVVIQSIVHHATRPENAGLRVDIVFSRDVDLSLHYSDNDIVKVMNALYKKRCVLTLENV